MSSLSSLYSHKSKICSARSVSAFVIPDAATLSITRRFHNAGEVTERSRELVIGLVRNFGLPLRFRLRHLRLLDLPPSPATNLCAPQVRSPVQEMMSEYPRTGSYRGPMYERGIDAKIVIMGNTGSSPLLSCLGHSPSPAFLLLFPQVWGRLACCNDIPRTSSTPRTRHPQPELFSSRRRCTRTG